MTTQIEGCIRIRPPIGQFCPVWPIFLPNGEIFMNCLRLLSVAFCVFVSPSALLFAGQIAGLSVDGIVVDGFDPNWSEYKYYLPFDYKGTPTITLGTTKIVVENTDDVSFETMVNNEKKTYKIVFERLPKLDLFLCIGQSNMAGRGPMDKSQGDLEPISDVYLFTPNGNWELASNPLNRYSTVRKDLAMQQISPAYGFAKKLSARTKRPIGLVVNALGGSRIESWTKGHADGLYEAALKRALAAKKWGEYKAILWHQGEGNSGRSSVLAYPAQLHRMVGDFRNDIGIENLLFVAGELGHWRVDSERNDNSRLFNEMIRRIDKFLDHATYVSAEALAPIGSNIADPHFDRSSQLIFGERYADAVFEHIYRSP